MTLGRRTAYAAVLAAAATLVGCATEATRTAPPPRVCRDWVAAPAYAVEIAGVRPLVARMKRAFGAPGLAVAIAADGELVWSSTCGFADARHRVRVDRRTQFRIGSVSKTVTATAAARLAQVGVLDLDADVRRYVPSFPRKPFPISLRQLGGHLGGIRHYEGSEVLSTRRYASVTAALAAFRDDPLVAKPGERFVYSSHGFNLLGAAIEGAARRRFGAVVARNVLGPLGMRRTRLDDGRAGVAVARFYEVTSRRRAVPAPRVDLSNRFPSGGFLSTAEDLAQLGTALTGDAFLAPRMRELLFTGQKAADGKPTGYGFGFEVGESPFGPVAGHTGNVVGGTAFLFVHPRTRVVVAMTTNIGYVTVATPPVLGPEVPDPPRLAVPFVRRVLAER